MAKNGRGQSCAYCRRTLRSSMVPHTLQATRDHVVPKAMGGEYTVWACLVCNNIKGSMPPDVWAEFMAAHPQWWEGYEYPHRMRLKKDHRCAVDFQAEPSEVRALARQLVACEFPLLAARQPSEA